MMNGKGGIWKSDKNKKRQNQKQLKRTIAYDNTFLFR